MEQLQDTQTYQIINQFPNLIDKVSAFALKLLGAIGAFILILILGKILAGAIKRMLIKHSDTPHVKKIANLVKDITYYVMLGFGVFVAFQILGFDIGLLLGGLSFGIGLAFKEILGNMIAGLMILYTKELKLGDIIEIQGEENYFGRIEEITIRYTIIRTLDLRQVIIPNLKMISSAIKTFSSEKVVRLSTIIGVHYNTNLQKAIPIIVEAINSLPFVIEKDNTTVYVLEFGESSINLKCNFYFNPNSGLTAEYAIGEVNQQIYKYFKQNGIKIPYPHINVILENGNKLENKI